VSATPKIKIYLSFEVKDLAKIYHERNKKGYKVRSPGKERIPLKNPREMSQLEVPRVCAQALEDPLPLIDEEELLTFESVLTVGGSLLPSKANVKKPLMEGYSDELELVQGHPIQ
jgi:hypothetical protein